MRNSVLPRQLWAGTKVLIMLTVVTGILYPAAVWAVSRVPGLQARAEGSIVSYDGRAVGSSLIGTNPVDPNAKNDPTDDRYFHTRPSEQASDFSLTDRTALGLGDINPAASGASNKGASDPTLTAQIAARKAFIAKREGVRPDQVPADAVTASGSGVDPAISPDYAYLQVARVARVNHLPAATVRQIVTDNVVDPPLGVLGEKTVNVLALNIAVASAVAAHGG
ncbi:MAG TPA: potassium-transporting ATPase subunit C [Pseudonocardiaceae bacterium]|jgi:K+-transporting ATPase ATPase C chain|nr:potassium-transporting ATPase subunit C [Pseudonocardiaceae bacterium]